MPTSQKVRFQNLEITLSQDGDRWLTVDVRPFAPPVAPPLPPLPAWSWPKPAAGIFAAPGGSAAGTGTITNPMALEKALTLGGAGQQIWLRGGAYSPAQTINPRLGGTAARPWKISAYPGEEPTIQINTGSRHGVLFNSAAMAFQEWRGIRFTDPTPGPGGTTVYNLLKADAGNAVSFIHCQFDNCKRSGILLNATVSNFLFYGCVILNNGVDAQKDHGAYVRSRAGLLTFENCFFVGNASHQLHAYNGSLAPEEGIRGIRALDNTILTFGEPCDRFMIFYDDGQTKEARDCHATGNVCFNEFPAPAGDGTDADRSTIKIVNGINSSVSDNFVWGGSVAMNGGAPTILRNEVMPSGVWPRQQVWVRPSRLDAGIIHATVFNPALAAEVAADLSGLVPLGRYEVRAASSPQKVISHLLYSGAGQVALPMGGLDYAAQVRTGGFAFRGSGRAMGFILRRVP